MGFAPDGRVTLENNAPVNPFGQYVLYWMTGARRTRFNHALDHARAHAAALGRPLLVFEAVRAGYDWAAPRHHAFLRDGMRDNAARFAAAGIRWVGHIEPAPGASAGLLDALAAQACLVVRDASPVFFLPRLGRGFVARCPVRVEAVDAVGVLPLSAADRPFPTAHAFRRHLQKVLPAHLRAPPQADPLAGPPAAPVALERSAFARWPLLHSPAEVDAVDLRALPLAGAVPPAPGQRGGEAAAQARWAAFRDRGLDAYDSARNEPAVVGGSTGLSPFFHYGMFSAWQILADLEARHAWSAADRGPPNAGSREGWWGLPAAAEALLDQVLTWRELGHVFAAHVPDPESFGTLPDWARATLDAHRGDPRPSGFTLDRLEAADTPDPIWNAAQRQLRESGTIHNYLRMLWGKKILGWAPTPEQALEWSVTLNHRYALDGRDPNSTAGLTWIFGRFDRAWGPERPIFGTVRYMTSENTARKYDLKPYLARWGAGPRAQRP
jgi:deoxyribodipyrimidine photo-lyase